MSWNGIVCESCGLPHEDYVYSCSCGRCFCSLDCAGAVPAQDENDMFNCMDCDYCTLKEISNYNLLTLALDKLGISRAQLEEEYRKDVNSQL